MPPRLLAPALLLVTFLAAAAHADPIVVTGGFLQNVRLGPEQGSRSMDAAGSGFGARAGDAAPVLRTPGCSVCFNNGIYEFDELFLATSDAAIMHLGGGLTVGGVTYGSSLFNSSVFFSVNTEPAALGIPHTNPETFTRFVHFTATGSYSVTDRATSQVIASGLLTGQGIAEVLLKRELDPLLGQIYVTQSVTYRFNDTPPVPEPATLVLFGLGSGGLWLVKRRRAKR